MFMIRDRYLRYETSNLSDEEIPRTIQTGNKSRSVYYSKPLLYSILHKHGERLLGPSYLVQRHAYHRSCWHDIRELLPLRPEAFIVTLSQTREEQECCTLA